MTRFKPIKGSRFDQYCSDKDGRSVQEYENDDLNEVELLQKAESLEEDYEHAAAERCRKEVDRRLNADPEPES